ncbi:MAG: YigZ family protein [Clostridia bacterium]|nr:YigZ family protein [Clostridia bacterium]
MAGIKEYRTIEQTSAIEYDEKKSRFIGVVTHVENQEQIDSFLASLKKANKDAKHICYGYCLGIDKSITKNNDDGEPAGTAGVPISQALAQSGLTDTLVAVVRYFGGIKLGASRLLRAYHTAAKEALAGAKVAHMVDCAVYALTVKYPDFVPIGTYLRDNKITIISAEYGECVKLRIAIPSQSADKHISELKLKMQDEFLCSKVDSAFFKVD